MLKDEILVRSTEIELEDLKRVVKLVKIKGAYYLLQHDPEVKRAVYKCHLANASEAEIREAIEKAYFEDWP